MSLRYKQGVKTITGMEAWSLVAPLIAAHSVATHTENGSPSLNALDEAYIIVFGALKEHDEKVKEERKKSNGTAYRQK